MGDALNTIVPIVLLFIAIIWIWATFGDPIRRFYEWVKGFTGSSRERFKPQNPANMIKEFTYS